MANVNKLLEDNDSKIKKFLETSRVSASARAFSKPEKGEVYTFIGVKDVDLPNRSEPYTALEAKKRDGTAITFWPSWLFSSIEDTEGNRHTATLDGEPIWKWEIDDDFPSAIRCAEVEEFTARRRVYTNGIVTGIAEKTCAVYHWESVE